MSRANPPASVGEMSARDTVTFYLPPKLRRQAENGNHNFILKVSDVLTAAGLTVAFDGNDDLARLRSLTRAGRGLFFMDPPANARSLTFRRTYMYPFWRIEAEAERWNWPVAKKEFDPETVDHRKAANFYRFWRKRLFDDAIHHISHSGFVYVPLQGQILRQRSFQSASPIEMIKTVLKRDPLRQVIVTLHPKETYNPEDQFALESLLAENDRLVVRAGDMTRYLQSCDYVVTQNSGVGLMGYFFGKPLIQFGKSDFHHIARSVERMGAEAAFNNIVMHQPDYAAYLYWFLQLQSINAGRAEAPEKIRDRLQKHGWPV